MNREQRRQVYRSLKQQGFDQTRSFKSGTVRPGCSQCHALVINGMACHETGCPNILNDNDRDTCRCGEVLDTDCFGNMRCPSCDPPCLRCYDGGCDR